EARLTERFELGPYRPDFRWRMVRRLMILPSENLDEISLARFVHTLQDQMRRFRHQAETAIGGPGLGVNLGEFGFFVRAHPVGGNHGFRTAGRGCGPLLGCERVRTQRPKCELKSRRTHADYLHSESNAGW